MPKISVIVPVYKVERFLHKCVESILSQSLDDIEIILVDDGSPDKCSVFCDEFASRDKRVKVIHKKNAGVSAARNDGLQNANGDYVIFCDSDDWMDVKGLEFLYEKAVSTHSDVVIGDVYMAKDKMNKYVSFYKDEFETSDKDKITELIKADIYRTYCPNPPIEGPAFGYGGPWNKLVRRGLLNTCNIRFDLRVKGIFDDILYTAYILANARKISYVKKPVYYYRVLDTSITHTYKPNVIELNDLIFNSWEEFFESQINGTVYRRPFYACVLRRLEEAIKLYFVHEKNDNDKNVLKVELANLIKREPYKTAIRKVEISKLSKKQRLLVYLGKVGLTNFIFTGLSNYYKR